MSNLISDFQNKILVIYIYNRINSLKTKFRSLFMKKTANKWLLLFASIFLMTAVACSNSAGGGDGNNDTPETPETPAETFKGIKIQIPASSIPADAMVREVYVNDEKVSSDSNNSHVRDTEWGYPFVDAGKSYEVYAKYINSSWETVLTTETVTIQAESGLGETKCPNKACSVTNNTLQFANAPVVYFGNTNIASYTNLKSGTEPEYIVEVFTDNWVWQYNACLGRGANFSYTTGHNFAQQLPPDFDSNQPIIFELYCKIEDKTYGNYRQYICKTSDRTVTLNVTPAEGVLTGTETFNASNLIPSVDDLKDKKFYDVKSIKINDREGVLRTYYEFNGDSNTDGQRQGIAYKQFFYNDVTPETPASSNESQEDIYYKASEGTIKDNSGSRGILITKIGNDFYKIDDEPLRKISGIGLNAQVYLEYRSSSYVMQETMSFSSDGTIIASMSLKDIATDEIIQTQSFEGTFTDNNGFITITLPGQDPILALYTGDEIYGITGKFENYTTRPAYPSSNQN